MTDPNPALCPTVDLSEFDVIAAMKEIPGYIDISPGDFKEVFRIAYVHALRRTLESRTAKDIMTSPVQCLHVDTSLVEAAKFLADQHFSGGPVIDADGRLVGVVSEKDFLAKMGIGQHASMMQVVTHCLSHKGCMVMDLRNHVLGDIMHTPAITAGPDMTMGAIAALFAEKQINRVPIVDKDMRPIGIVTRSNLVHAYRPSPLGGDRP